MLKVRANVIDIRELCFHITKGDSDFADNPDSSFFCKYVPFSISLYMFCYRLHSIKAIPLCEHL